MAGIKWIKSYNKAMDTFIKILEDCIQPTVSQILFTSKNILLGYCLVNMFHVISINQIHLNLQTPHRENCRPQGLKFHLRYC